MATHEMKLEAWTFDGRRLTADEAAVMHKPGDRYIDQKTGKLVQLHVCTAMRNHFEFMRNQDHVPVYAAEGWEEF